MINGMTFFREFLRRTGEKLKENKGSIYINLMWLIFSLMLTMAVYIEYNRANHILKTVDMAYERALTSVAVNNYDEMFENVREEEATGGGFEGGNSGEFEEEEVPTYFTDEDYGELEEELERLLGLTKFINREEIVKVRENGQYEFSLSDFKARIRQDGLEIDGKYRINGEVKIKVPIYFLSLEVTSLELKVKSTATWRTKW